MAKELKNPIALEKINPTQPERKRKPAQLRAWEKDYPDYKLWDSQRWAWEFLRRNTEFITDCDSIKSRNLAKQNAIAEKYGLSFFKHYSEKKMNHTLNLSTKIRSCSQMT